MVALQGLTRRERKELSVSDMDAEFVASSGGMRIVPDLDPSKGSRLPQVPAFNGLPANALAFTLEQISRRYGLQTANLVALQLEYDWTEHRT